MPKTIDEELRLGRFGWSTTIRAENSSLLFWSLAHARVTKRLETEYNHHRRHSALGYQAPGRYAEQCTHQ